MYVLNRHGGVMRADGAAIPDDPANRDWRDYEVWIAAGNTPGPAPEPPRPTRTATAKQLRYALAQTGRLEAWEAAVASASAATGIYWRFEADPPETNGKMRRLATAAGVDLSALYDLATTL